MFFHFYMHANFYLKNVVLSRPLNQELCRREKVNSEQYDARIDP